MSALQRSTSDLLVCCLSLVLILATGAGAEETVEKKTDAQVLRERAEAYWAARVAREQAVFDYYEAPDEAREKAAEFGNMRYLEAVIEDVVIRGDEATVRVQAHVNVPLPPGMRRGDGLERLSHPILAEKWDRGADGTWYKRPISRSLARFQKSLRGNRGEAATTEESTAAEGNANATAGPPASVDRARSAETEDGD